jgi:tetratricopeptide (TPR) repeat protein
MSCGAHALRAVIAALGASVFFACSSPEIDVAQYTPPTSKYDVLPATALDVARQARAQIAAGDQGGARALIAGLVQSNPDHVALAIWLQELDFAAAPAEGKVAVAAAARELAASEPSVTHMLLAARLESDEAKARATLEQAQALDRECAWTHYALAHLDAKQGHWPQAQHAVARAIQLDPGNVAARRLEAAILARNGRRSEAISALRAWLSVTRDDPLVDSATRVLAELDLAQLQLLEGDEDKAREVLLGLASDPTDPVRRDCLLAAVEQALGHADRALNAARAAEARDARAPLPLEQQAILQEHALSDPAAARRAWERVLELARKSSDLGALILSLRARVALERAAPPTTP